MSTSFEIRRPDDWHVHLRDNEVLKTTVNATARIFKRAIVMPNLKTPITTTKAAIDYQKRILFSLNQGFSFEPLITLFLQDQMDTKDIEEGLAAGVFSAAKLYPAHATTNSAHGVSDVENITEILKLLVKYNKPLLVHGEVTAANVDTFDREKVFIKEVLGKICSDFANLKVVFEHITSADAVKFVRSHAGQVGATITPHHLKLNRNAMFAGGIRPHNYCLPVLKREEDRLALVDAATSGESSFFLGTDSAPHSLQAKEAACGCAGIYNAPLALEWYAEIFEQVDKLDKLENFASVFGAEFYGLPLNEERVLLSKKNSVVPAEHRLGPDYKVKPFCAGETISWSANLL